MKQNEWQPIETAPKDGTWVLLLFEDEYDQFSPLFQIYEGFHSLRAWRTRDHVRGKPTCWMPLKLPLHIYGEDKKE